MTKGDVRRVYFIGPKDEAWRGTEMESPAYQGNPRSLKRSGVHPIFRMVLIRPEDACSSVSIQRNRLMLRFPWGGFAPLTGADVRGSQYPCPSALLLPSTVPQMYPPGPHHRQNLMAFSLLLLYLSAVQPVRPDSHHHPEKAPSVCAGPRVLLLNVRTTHGPSHTFPCAVSR